MNSIHGDTTNMCPFCPLFETDPREWWPVEPDEGNIYSHIGTIRSCSPCAKMAKDIRTEDVMDMLKKYQEKQAKEKGTHHG